MTHDSNYLMDGNFPKFSNINSWDSILSDWTWPLTCSSYHGGNGDRHPISDNADPTRCPKLGYLMHVFFFHAAWFHIFHVLHMTDGFTSIVSQCLSSPHFWGVLRLQKGYKVAKLMQLSSFFSKLGLRRGSSSCKKCLIAGGAKSAKNLPSSFDRAMPTPSLTPICPQRLGEQTCHCHCPSFPCNLLGDLQLPGVV